MANRSYLYSFNQDKTEKITKIFDISEQNYEIPIIYKILVSENTEIVTSKLFDDSFALKGDAKAGRKRLNAFFKKLHKEKIYDDAELTDLEKMFQNHLDKYTLDYFLFEPVEVLSMDNTVVNAEVKLIASEISSYNKMIANFIQDSDAEGWSELGIDFSNYLYFSMGDKKEVKKTEKQFSNKKLAEVKTLIARKPTAKRYFSLLKELDFKKEAAEVNNTIDEIVKLKPNYKQLWDCAYYYQDLDKKIALFKQLIIDYPNEEKTKAINYWISNAYENKKEYDLALKYRIQYLIDRKEPNEDPYLENIIKKGNFNEVEVYQNISKKIKIKTIEKRLIEILIEQKKYDKAFNRFYELKDFLSDKGINNWRKHQDIHSAIARMFLDANQLEKGMQIVEDTNTR